MTVSIGKRIYASIEKAVYSYESGEIIKLDADTVEDAEFFGKTMFTLDLNGKTLTNKAGPAVTVLTAASLRIIDSSKEKTGIVDSVLNGQPAIMVRNGATLYLEGGKVTRSAEDSDKNTSNCVINYGSLTISDDTVVESTSVKNAAVRNGFDTNKVSDRKYLADLGDGYSANLNLNGGIVTGGQIAIKNDEFGMATISGGAITANKEALLTWSPCIITGGSFTATEGAAVAFGTNKGPAGRVTIYGGSFKGSGAVGPIAPINPSKPHTTPDITGGSFSKTLDEGYYPATFEIRETPDGMFTLVSKLWDIIHMGVNKLVFHKDQINYTSGGVVLPIPVDGSILIAATSKNGTCGYYNSAENKVILFHGATEVKAGSVEDLTIVFLVR